MPVQVIRGQSGMGFVHHPTEVQVRVTDAGNNPRVNEAVQLQVVRGAATVDPAAGGQTDAQGQFTFRVTPTVAAPGIVRVTVAGEHAEVNFTGEVVAHDAVARANAAQASKGAARARAWAIAALLILSAGILALAVFSGNKLDKIAGKIGAGSKGSDFGKKLDEAIGAAKGAERAAKGAEDAAVALHGKIGEVPPVPLVGSKDCFEDPEQEACVKAAAQVAKGTKAK